MPQPGQRRVGPGIRVTSIAILVEQNTPHDDKGGHWIRVGDPGIGTWADVGFRPHDGSDVIEVTQQATEALAGLLRGPLGLPDPATRKITE